MNHFFVATQTPPTHILLVFLMGTSLVTTGGCQSFGVDDTIYHGPTCGNQEIDGIEECDDGDQESGDGCSSTCEIETGWQCNDQEPTQCVLGTMVLIEAGSFQMGSPIDEFGRDGDEQLTDVTLTHDFSILSTETTQGEFEDLIGWNPSSYHACGSDCPVTNVSWYDAVAYANQLSLQHSFLECYRFEDAVCVDDTPVGSTYSDCLNETRGGIKAASVTLNQVSSVFLCEGYRLPTEAEWEYASRAETITATHNGNLDESVPECEQPNSVLDSIGWFCGNSDDHSHPKGGKDPNPWGLFDMLGNVWEWCHNYYQSSYDRGPLSDPEGPTEGSSRALRGAGFRNRAINLRAAERTNGGSDNRLIYYGFRISRTLSL